MNPVERTKRHFYPETRAGGFSAVDGTVQFYSRVNALIEAQFVVVDLGAGRGQAALEDPVPYRRGLRSMKGKCARVVGLDIDQVVLANPSVDEAYVIGADGRFPLPDESVDLILSDVTFEHVDQPEQFSREVGRVVKPGGWVCARTPNLFGYIGLGATLVPNRFHIAMLRTLQPHRRKHDVFATRYKLNTKAALKRHFPVAAWEHTVYTWNAEPAYFGASRLGWRLMRCFFGVCPSSFGAMLFIFLQKRARGCQ